MRSKNEIKKDIDICLASMNRIVQREQELALKGHDITEKDYDRFLILQEEFKACMDDYHHYCDELDGKSQN